MALYVFISETCKDDAEKHGQTENLRKVKSNIERSQNLAGFHSLLPTLFVKKDMGRSFRLIGYCKRFEDDELVILYRFLTRSSKDYEHFLAHKNWTLPYNDEELQRIYKQLKSDAPIFPLPKLSGEELAWLYQVFGSEKKIDDLTDDLIALETEKWVKKMKAEENRDFLGLYHQLLESSSGKLYGTTDNNEVRDYWGEQEDLGIAYLYRHDINRLLLLEPLRRRDEFDPKKYTDMLAKISSAKDEQLTEDKQLLLRVAARSYPFYMVLDRDAWLKIQKDEEANLALSPEEAELLDSVRQMGTKGQLSYPLFINGRAGSGKSTMLQYLAADYICFVLRQGASQQLLYTTCSRELLDRARKVVERLLTVSYKQLLEGPYDQSKVAAVLESCFVVFRDFLYSLLPAEMQQRLPQEGYVDYPRFRRLWDEEFAKHKEARRMSPDVAWHTIRSYIKGIRSSRDDELGPEEFKALPRGRRSVSEETYKQVYERVWQSWYKKLCDEKCYWDDQDLAACVVETGSAQTINCAALFCDEAQDFTPLELDIIYQLSLFGRRSLQPEELKRVPIVFAGDPLQTINPTGFRWEAVKADFHDRFYAVLDPRRKADIRISHQELNHNYRSNRGVVRFCNLIQLARAALLGLSDITPQKPWWVDEPKIVYLVEDTEATEGLGQRLDFVKLVNCEEGEEASYVDKDPILSKSPEKVEGIYRNVFSPMRAKGLEFPAVVLYRFGDTAPPDFEKLLRGEVDIDAPEVRLPYEYFFNRLYVAASRAKRDLVIVDSRDAIQKFWQFATEPEWVDRLMQRIANGRIWCNHTAQAIRSAEKWWEGEKVHPHEQAQDYEREGRVKRDPYLLRQAALAYRSAGNEHAAGKCLALAAELESKYQDAGDKYRDLGLREEAFRCYWKGREWARICDLAMQDPACVSPLERRAADFMNRAVVPDSNFLNELIRAAHDDAWFRRVSHDPVWRYVFITLAQRLTKMKAGEALPWEDIFEILKRLQDKGTQIEGAALATIAYRANRFADAVELWEYTGDVTHKEYHRAKARVTDFPENIVWFHRAGEHSEVLRQWCKHQPTPDQVSKLEQSAVRAVVDAALAEHDFSLAVNLLRSSLDQGRPDQERTAKLLVAAIEESNVELTREAAAMAVRLFVRAGDWAAAVRAAEDADFSGLLDKKANENLQSMLRNTEEGVTSVFRAVVEELAGSETLISATTRNKEPVADFLYRSFIQKGVKLSGLSQQVVGAALERVDKALRERAKRDLVDAIEKPNIESAQAAAVSAARLLVYTRDWAAAVRAAEDADFSDLLDERAKDFQSMLRNAEEGVTSVFRAVVEELAGSETLVSETTRNKEPVADFLNRSFIQEGVKLPGLSPQVVGAAIERAGKIVDALQFYEVLQRSASTEELRQFATERLVRNLERHADYLRSRGEEAQAQQRQLRAQEIRRRFHLGNRLIPDYPVLGIRTQPAEPSEWTLGPLKIVLSRAHGRLRVEHTKRFETVTLDREGKLRGDADFSQVKGEDGELAAWEVPDWNARVSVVAQEAGKHVVVKIGSQRSEFTLDMAS